jgi:hypothetical protein
VERVLLPFFDGLLPEDWPLEVAERNWKPNPATAWVCTASLPPGRRWRRQHSTPLHPSKTHEPLPLLLLAPTSRGPQIITLHAAVTPPAFLYSEALLLALAEQIVCSHITVKGVQPKL